ncbi:hypothetical protein [Sporichthya sp.]|uniref:hypothetical protein n=1 Tax=Sporichthya sp. TaxID=65475 RepID=UPI0017EFAE7E|nr:hypothetical protein [Sporichthya sp.]MBA3745245.1 hypothetical protein [Sporichthya sp.]
MTEIKRAAEDAADKLEQVAEEAATELEQVAVEAEAIRAAAEEKRQKQERDRRIAEGGTQIVLTEDEQEETGRVEAEGGRVEAETRRESVSHGRREAENQRVEAETRRVQRDKRLLPRISVLIALPLAFVSLIPSLLLGYYLYDRQQSTRDVAEDNRKAIERADDAIEQIRALTVAVSAALQGRDEGLADAVSQQCRENEVQDAIIVSVLRTTGTNPEVELPPEVRQDFRDAIVALEPKGEEPCPLRPGIEP